MTPFKWFPTHGSRQIGRSDDGQFRVIKQVDGQLRISYRTPAHRINPKSARKWTLVEGDFDYLGEAIAQASEELRASAAPGFSVLSS